MTLTFHRYGSTDTTDALELDETKSSIIDKLSEPTRLSAILTSETAPKIALGNYTTYNGTRYYVTKEPTVRKEHSQLYTVEVDLERSLGLARITILANPVDHRTTFDYTATATEHLQLIVDCLNAKFGEVGLKWTRGAVHCKDTVKHIKYDGATVLGALQQIRETYETDIFADGETLSLGQEEDKSTALPLAYGKGKGLLSGLERHKHTDDTVPNRLYVTGTKRNMTKGRLTLERDVVLAVDPKSGTIERDTGGMTIKPDGRTRYRTDKAGQYIAEWSPTEQFVQWGYRFPTEATYTNEDIYPSHVSTIKTVTKVKDHYEVNSDFDYDKFRINGEQMQVVFQTGNLAGQDFDAKYMSSTGRLAVVPKEEDDTTLPNDTLCPKIGDQYIVTGIKLPDQYIREAERNLTDEALRHLVKLQETRYSYKADIDPVYLHNNHDKIAPQLAVGRYVRLTDPQIAIGDPDVRIVGKRTYLDRPYTPEIELSNEIEPRSELTRVLNELDRQDEGLASILERLRQSGLVLSDLTLSSDAMRQRVEAAEQALAGKASTVDVKQSARDAIAEAIKRAGEMDKEIKVGGRNLIVTSRWKAGYLYGDRDENAYPVGSENYKVLVGYDTFRFDPVYIPTLGESKVTYKLYDNGGSKNGTVQIHAYDKDKKFLCWTCDGWDGTIGHTSDWPLSADTAYIRIGVTNENVRAKVEFGSVATDWTPAPEDVDAQVESLKNTLKQVRDKLGGKLDQDTFNKWLEGSYHDHLRVVEEDSNERKNQIDRLIKDLEDNKHTVEVNREDYEKWLNEDYSKQKEYVELTLKPTVAGQQEYITRTLTPTIAGLQRAAIPPKLREDLDYLTESLQILRDTNNKLEGVALQRHIALSRDGEEITAYLASDALPAVLKAGITDFGKPTEREQVAICHNGTGHLGNLYFAGNQIDFRTSRYADPYLSIGAEENQFIEDFIDTARLDDTPVSVSTVTLTNSTTSYERTVDVANDGTRLTVSIDNINIATSRGDKTRLTLDGEVLDEWEGRTEIRKGWGNIEITEVPYKASDLSYERVVKAGRHTLRIEIVKPTNKATATISGLRVRRRYDTERQQSALTKSGLRLFGSPDMYFDVDYRKDYWAYSGIPGHYSYQTNPYLVRIKGGAKIDKLTVDKLDMPGVPLCGASFNENGTQIKAFGKYANQRGTNRAQAEYDYDMKAYKVYHSIGNTNYIPIVQVSGWNSGDVNWSLTPRVYEVSSYYFVVRILSNNDNPHSKAISYVAFKTE